MNVKTVLMASIVAFTTLSYTIPSIAIAKEHVKKNTKDKPKHGLRQLDTNKDKAISLKEFLAGPDHRFNAADLNGDGELTLEEMLQHHTDLEAIRQARADERSSRVGERFTEFDTDGNGIVTAVEAKSAIFNKLDTNGDGVISRKEAKKAKKHKRRHQRHDDRADDESENDESTDGKG